MSKKALIILASFALLVFLYGCDFKKPADADGDGWFVNLPSRMEADCNDNDAEVHPEARELCDGKDNDCDNALDEGCEACPEIVCITDPCPDQHIPDENGCISCASPCAVK
ncbi:MAG TPA: putative metal-binding motif-containing protein [Candidatus Nanoarchaeia archaeon]|nr:putative metal-binding motif-containing protein [Candidatus Nanoarchaeia archaeon]